MSPQPSQTSHDQNQTLFSPGEHDAGAEGRVLRDSAPMALIFFRFATIEARMAAQNVTLMTSDHQDILENLHDEKKSQFHAPRARIPLSFVAIHARFALPTSKWVPERREGVGVVRGKHLLQAVAPQRQRRGYRWQDVA